MSLISNSGHDENGKYLGGKAGDQTGTEWALIPWYNRPWKCVLRHPDAKVRAKLAELGIKAAKNNLVGYDQNQREEYQRYLYRQPESRSEGGRLPGSDRIQVSDRS